MKLQFFAIPALNAEAALDQLNALLASHRIVGVEKHFVADGSASYWSICVTFLNSAAASPSARRDRIDYREVLTEADFTVYADLRTLRKTIAERDGLPPYALFTNEQLAAMVTQRVATLPALAQIDGVGKARVDKYGSAFIDLLQRAFAARPAATA